MHVKRAHFVLFDLADDHYKQVAALLGGDVDTTANVNALALSTGRREPLTREEFEALLRVPAVRTIDADEIGEELARSLVERGLLVDDVEKRTARRDATMLDNGWNLYAAAYHFMTQRTGMDLREAPQMQEWSQVGNEAMQDWVERYGPSPPPFHDRAPEAPRTTLPRFEPKGGLYDALKGRRTTRTFATDTPMRLEDLATIVYYVFGAHGTAKSDLGVMVKRTSPSGGARHAIEAYALISNVEDVEPGIYHYDMRVHALSRLEARDAADVRETATQFMCGQDFLAEAHVSFVLTARFERCYWKYRRMDKAYASLLMEAGALTQTLYLLAVERDLGAWVTLAINSPEIEECLEIDGCDEGVLAMVGCGPRLATQSPFDTPFGAAESGGDVRMDRRP
jgi:putative peptide maturation dehydrogenase